MACSRRTSDARCRRKGLALWIFLGLSSTHYGNNGVTSLVLPYSKNVGGLKDGRATTTGQQEQRRETFSSDQWLLPTDLIMLSRKIQKCGSDMAAVMEILEKVPMVIGPPRPEVDRNLVHLLLQPVYLQALEVLNRSIRHRHSPVTTTTTTTPSSSSSTVLLQSLRETAVKLYQDCPTESVRARAIAVCSSIDDRNHTILTELLYSPRYPPPGLVTINAALAALARDKDWVLARTVLFHHASLVTTMSCNIVLLAMERAQQGTAAIELLEQMLRPEETLLYLPKPDRSSYHHVMRAIVGRDNNNNVSAVDDAYQLMVRMQNSCYPIIPNNETFDIFATSYGRRGDWTLVGLVDNLRLGGSNSSHVFPDPETYRATTKTDRRRPSSTMHWNSSALGLKQAGSGKEAWWEIATYINTGATTRTIQLVVALQPHRNPSKNGIKILLLDNDDSDAIRCHDKKPRKKAGFLLMVNRRNDNTSTMIGVYIRPDLRRLGLSKTILSIWLDLCQQAGLTAKTGVINKPLLALVLEHTFGFSPQPGGVMIEVVPGSSSSNGKVALYAPSIKSMEGVFSSWDLKRENIELLNRPPATRGKLCHIKTAFELARDHDDAFIPSECGTINKGRLVYHSADTPWRRVILGTSGSHC
jgi:hypothetical protein